MGMMLGTLPDTTKMNYINKTNKQTNKALKGLLFHRYTLQLQKQKKTPTTPTTLFTSTTPTIPRSQTISSHRGHLTPPLQLSYHTLISPTAYQPQFPYYSLLKQATVKLYTIQIQTKNVPKKNTNLKYTWSSCYNRYN
jgi:hypothetical protein